MSTVQPAFPYFGLALDRVSSAVQAAQIANVALSRQGEYHGEISPDFYSPGKLQQQVLRKAEKLIQDSNGKDPAAIIAEDVMSSLEAALCKFLPAGVYARQIVPHPTSRPFQAVLEEVSQAVQVAQLADKVLSRRNGEYGEIPSNLAVIPQDILQRANALALDFRGVNLAAAQQRIALDVLHGAAAILGPFFQGPFLEAGAGDTADRV